MNKCDSHDDCFHRLYTQVEGMDDKLDRLFGELHNRLHDGEVRFVQLEMRLAHCEKTIASSVSGRFDIKQKLVNTAFDVLKLAIVGILGAAYWAFMNGYGK